MVDWKLTLVALSVGLVMGGVFKFLRVPMPAPPELPGLMGIVGVYLGYKLMEATGAGYDVLKVIGAA
jgi:XapX domain-containing protein